jgi:hypothetical protein
MRSIATDKFWRLYLALPDSARQLADKTFRLWRDNPTHPSLRFRRLQGASDRYTVRIGDHYRALAYRDGELVVWVWIGTHGDYDQMTNAS